MQIKNQELSRAVEALLPAVVVCSGVFLFSDPAFAEAIELTGPAKLLAGRSASLLHPLTNLALFGTSVYSAYLGLQWKRLRTIGEELKALGKELPKLSSGAAAKTPFAETEKSILALLSSMGEESTSEKSALQADLRLLESANGLDKQILELSSTRKKLLSMDLRDKHYMTGSILLGVGVSVAVLGCLNTYLRAGKLYPGPHLFAGAGIVMLWALAAALVPEMTKGNESARIAHISLNSINIALFAWQVSTGLDIMAKVYEFTSWP